LIFLKSLVVSSVQVIFFFAVSALSFPFFSSTAFSVALAKKIVPALRTPRYRHTTHVFPRLSPSPPLNHSPYFSTSLPPSLTHRPFSSFPCVRLVTPPPLLAMTPLRYLPFRFGGLPPFSPCPAGVFFRGFFFYGRHTPTCSRLHDVSAWQL